MADAVRELTPEEIEANVARAKAEARLANAQADAAIAEQVKLAAEARSAIVDADRDEDVRRRELATDSFNRVYRFVGTIDDHSVSSCIRELAAWDRLAIDCDIEVDFSSPGGSVLPGMALYDYLIELRRLGHRITTVALGYALSMGGIALQAGDHRVMGRESYILVHQITAGTMGKIDQMKDDVHFYEHICDRVVDIFVARSGGKLTRRRMLREWTGHDWWLDSTDALKYGIVDEVR